MTVKLALYAQILAGCLLLGAIPAGASTIDIGLATSSTGTITTEASGAGTTGAGFTGTYDNYLLTVQAADPTPINLASGTIDITLPAGFGGATAPLYIYVTETGLTSSQATLNFQSSLDVENLPSGWTETEATYVNSSDQEYGTSTQLASMTVSKVASGAETVAANGVDAGSDFSLTEVYEIVSNGIGGIGASTASIIDPAPAPSLGSGISGMLAVGGVLLGWKLLERRRQV